MKESLWVVKMNYVNIENLSFSYDDKKIFSNVNMQIRKGDFISILSSNSSGKTTFLKLIKGAFAQRRKTLINNLMQMNIPKEKTLLALEKMNLDKAIRSEALSIEEFARLSDILLEMEV